MVVQSKSFALLLKVLLSGLVVSTVISDGVKNPVVIVPGILGSQLWAKLDKNYTNHIWCREKTGWFDIWLSIEELLWPFEECASNNIMLIYDNTTKEYSNQAGVETNVPGFGDTNTVEFLDPSLHFEVTNYFHNMVDYLVSNMGYVRGKTIRAAPYDWRFSPEGLQRRGYFNALKELIEEVYNDSGDHQVTLVVHSMGGPISLYFLTKLVEPQWKEKYIKQYITLSAVWAGAAKSARAIVSGDNENIFIDRPIWGRASQRTYQSTLWLLPPASDVWTDKDVLVSHLGHNYTAFDYHSLFDNLNYTFGWDMYLGVKDLIKGFPPPNITTYCYYGFDVCTPRQFIYSEGYPNEPPSVINSNGDGTVNERSLKVCERWKKQQPQDVYEMPFSGVEHVDVVKNSDVINAVADILKKT